MKRALIRIGVVLLLLGLLFGAWRWYLADFTNARLAEIHAAGLPTNGRELNDWYPAVPDSQNAALVLTQAFASHRGFSDARSNLISAFNLPKRTETLSAEQTGLLKAYIALNAPELAKADEALSLPASRYPVDCTRLMDTELPHLGWLRELVRLHEYSGILSIQSGDPAAASSNVVTMLALARTLDNEPCLISQLVRLKILHMACDTLERRAGAASLPADEIKRLTVAFANMPTTNVAMRALVGERAMTIPYFRMSMAELRRINPGHGAGGMGRDSLTPCEGPVFLRLIGYYELDFGSYLVGMKRGLELAGQPIPGNLEANGFFLSAARMSAKRHRAISAIVLDGYSNVASRQNEGVARQRLALVTLAVEQFRNESGRLPEKLEELADVSPDALLDPFNGLPLNYRRTDHGYILYSVGPDRADDGGLEQADKKDFSNQKNYDITFTVER